MIKNIVIIFLLACLGILFYDNNNNVNIIKDSMVDGTNYLKKSFSGKEEGSGSGIEEETFFVEEDNEK